MAGHDEILTATTAGDAAMVRALLGDDPALAHARDTDGTSLVLAALYRGHRDVVDALRDAGTPLDVFEAAALGDEDSLRELLAADAAVVGAYNADGWTPLHLAAHFNRPDAAETLLAAGADANARSRNALTNQPLHAAVAGDAAPELVRALLAHGAEVNATQRGGFTPLHGAAQNGNVALVKLLLDAGAEADARTEDGKTARDFALDAGHGPVVRTLDLHAEEGQAREHVVRVVAGINAAWTQGRPEEMDPYLDDDVTLVSPGFQGAVIGKSAAIASYREFADKAAMREYRESDLSVRVWGDTAVATYRFAIDYDMGGASYHDTGHDVFVLRHRGGRWRAVWRTLVPERSEVVG